jgi:CheY-like chemotaxis protein
MPILNGFQATQQIRRIENQSSLNTPSYNVPRTSIPNPTTSSSFALPRSSRTSKLLNGRVPVFVVSATLHEHQRADLINLGIDGWILKPIDFKRLREFLQGILDPVQRERNLYHPGTNWELGGWLVDGMK